MKDLTSVLEKVPHNDRMAKLEVVAERAEESGEERIVDALGKKAMKEARWRVRNAPREVGL